MVLIRPHEGHDYYYNDNDHDFDDKKNPDKGQIRRCRQTDRQNIDLQTGPWSGKMVTMMTWQQGW